MIVVGTCVSADGSRYEACAAPTLETFRAAGDVVLTASGDRRGIASVYNTFIDAARARPDCEALVLVHDDVEILDENAREKILAALSGESVGLVGAIGARGVKSLAWWEGVGVGAVLESRGPITYEEREGNVDAVDGLLLILGRSAFGRLRFDEDAFPRFHGYDVDIALQVRDLGLQVRVIALDVFHRTRGGLGDERAFFAADTTLVAKWNEQHPELHCVARPVGPVGEARRAVLRWGRRRVHAARGLRDRSLAVLLRWRRISLDKVRRLRARAAVRRGGALSPCCVCGAALDLRRLRTVPGVVPCSDCGTGSTWPRPTQDPTASRIWEGQYGGRRAQKSSIWEREAAVRVQWLARYLDAGRVLDVGAATGEFVRAAAQQGYTAHGVEPSDWAVEHARREGAAVDAGFFTTWFDARYREAFDVITMWHVLEHVEDPAALLRDVRTRSREGARVVLEVPNFGSSEAARSGHRWHHLELSEHVHHFTPDGLRRLIESSGLEVVEVTELSERVYSTDRAWRRRWNEALVNRREWPSLDLLRAVAIVPG